jgi:hypothetical protein
MSDNDDTSEFTKVAGIEHILKQTGMIASDFLKERDGLVVFDEVDFLFAVGNKLAVKMNEIARLQKLNDDLKKEMDRLNQESVDTINAYIDAPVNTAIDAITASIRDSSRGNIPGIMFGLLGLDDYNNFRIHWLEKAIGYMADDIVHHCHCYYDHALKLANLVISSED